MFEAIKEALANTSLLTHPKPDVPMSIMVDALDAAVGGVCSNVSTTGGVPLLSSPRSSSQVKHATARLIESYWQST